MNDVEIPDGMDASMFLSRQIAALEGPITTTFLSSWIDLIFGVKQQGDEAVLHYNLFYYMTYPNQVDITFVTDAESRKSIITQVGHFGQCPAMVFDAPHPLRRPEAREGETLHEVLRRTNRDSLYCEGKAEWIGTHSRIVSISDVEDTAIVCSPFSIQNILGDVETSIANDCFFDPDSIYFYHEGIETKLPMIQCPALRLSWQANSEYPWWVLLDCLEYVSLSSVKIVLDNLYETDSNQHAKCYQLEYNEDGSGWKPVLNRSLRRGA